MGNYIELNESNFENEVLKSDLPVLVDFWAPWCGPCKMISPFIDEIAKEYTGKLKVCKLNTDEGFEISSKYQIVSIPTLILFIGGKEIKRIIGAMPKNQIVKFIEENLKK
ncbi:MAG: thioredoxin [Spirochaetes bacterium]|nr:thioredoxin [Spirochaetota bacterium]